MKVHLVKSAFQCRVGQFEPGKRSTCIGLDCDALKAVDIFRCYVGSSRRRAYEIESTKALNLAGEYNSIWKNPHGRFVAILPLKDFVALNCDFNREKMVANKQMALPV
jgi:hypothetical protein